jgi:hypothetical protein
MSVDSVVLRGVSNSPNPNRSHRVSAENKMKTLSALGFAALVCVTFFVLRKTTLEIEAERVESVSSKEEEKTLAQNSDQLTPTQSKNAMGDRAPLRRELIAEIGTLYDSGLGHKHPKILKLKEEIDRLEKSKGEFVEGLQNEVKVLKEQGLGDRHPTILGQNRKMDTLETK